MDGEKVDPTFIDDLLEDDFLFTDTFTPPLSPSLALLPASTSLLPSAIIDLPGQSMTSLIPSFSFGVPTDAPNIQKPNNHLKPKRKNQKGPKTQFRTKTDLNYLEDGFRWNKYGRKSVKGSPFQRHYYRCTTPDCGAKKMVERSAGDDTLITTYVGIHTHPEPPVRQAAGASGSGVGAGGSGGGAGGSGGGAGGSGGGASGSGGGQSSDAPIPAPLEPPPLSNSFMTAASSSTDVAGISDPMTPAPYELEDFFLPPSPLSYSYMAGASSSTDIAGSSSPFTVPVSSVSTFARISDPSTPAAPYDQHQDFFLPPSPLSYSYMAGASSSTDIAGSLSPFTVPVSSVSTVARISDPPTPAAPYDQHQDFFPPPPPIIPQPLSYSYMTGTSSGTHDIAGSSSSFTVPPVSSVITGEQQDFFPPPPPIMPPPLSYSYMTGTSSGTDIAGSSSPFTVPPVSSVITGEQQDFFPPPPPIMLPPLSYSYIASTNADITGSSSPFTVPVSSVSIGGLIYDPPTPAYELLDFFPTPPPMVPQPLSYSYMSGASTSSYIAAGSSTSFTIPASLVSTGGGISDPLIPAPYDREQRGFFRPPPPPMPQPLSYSYMTGSATSTDFAGSSSFTFPLSSVTVSTGGRISDFMTPAPYEQGFFPPPPQMVAPPLSYSYMTGATASTDIAGSSSFTIPVSSVSTDGRIYDPLIPARYEQQGIFPASPPVLPRHLSYSHMTAARSSSSTGTAAASSSFPFPMSSTSVTVMDTGFLEDMMPSFMRKEPRV